MEKIKIFMNNHKALKILGWNNKVNLNTGIDNTIIWFKKNIKEVKKMNKKYIHKK